MKVRFSLLQSFFLLSFTVSAAETDQKVFYRTDAPVVQEMTRASEVLHRAAGTKMYEHPAACHVWECANNTLSSLETGFSCAQVVDAGQPNCDMPGVDSANTPNCPPKLNNQNQHSPVH